MTWTLALSAALCLPAQSLSAGNPVQTVPAEDSRLLSPLAELKSRRAAVIHLQDLRDVLRDKISRTRSSDSVAIYVEDLNSGVWMGINERRPVVLASLLKVGLMIAWLKWDEDEPGLLGKKIRVEPRDILNNDPFSRAADSPLLPGVYRVADLIESMVVSSDNSAVETLSRNIPGKRVSETFSDIGLPNPFFPADTGGVTGTLSAKQYAQIFKSLYNAAYLDNAHSKLALRILCRTRFSRGLRGVLPEGTAAALKYGARWSDNVLLESGIVYLENNPYLICIFTSNMTDTKMLMNLSFIREFGSAVHAFLREIPAGRK